MVQFMEENKLSRFKQHENALICIYQILFYAKLEQSNRKSIIEIVSEVMETPYDECDDFFKEIIFLAVKNKKDYIDIISTYLSKEWTFNRLNLMEQAILLLYSSEIINKQIPQTIAINLAVDFTKKYCDDGSYKFINAVLDKVGKNYG